MKFLGARPMALLTISGADGSRKPSAVELDAARFQGQHVAMVAAKIAGDAGAAERPQRRTA